MKNTLLVTIVTLSITLSSFGAGFNPIPRPYGPAPASPANTSQQAVPTAPETDPARSDNQQQPKVETTMQPLNLIKNLVNKPDYISRTMETTVDVAQIGKWQVREISGKNATIVPVIVADAGFELNLDQITAEFEGDGTVQAGIIYYTSNDLEQAIEKNTFSGYKKLTSAKPERFSNRYKGHKFAWIVLAAEGKIKLNSLKHTCNLVEGGLYGHIAREYRFESGTLKYRIMYPNNYDPNKKYPLVISGPSSGGVGNDNSKNMEMVTLGGYLYYRYYNDPQFECFSIVPQIPDDKNIPAPYYPNGSKGLYDRNFHPAASLSAVNATGWYAQAVLALVHEMLESPELSLDPDRIYFTGFSYGGKACWEFLKAEPDLFAGVVCCAGWPIGMPYQAPNQLQLDRLKEEIAGYKHVPIYITAGEKDNMKLPSKIVNDEIIKQGGKSIYKEIPGANHTQSATSTWSDQSIVKWLFEQKKP